MMQGQYTSYGTCFRQMAESRQTQVAVSSLPAGVRVGSNLTNDRQRFVVRKIEDQVATVDEIASQLAGWDDRHSWTWETMPWSTSPFSPQVST